MIFSMISDLISIIDNYCIDVANTNCHGNNNSDEQQTFRRSTKIKDNNNLKKNLNLCSIIMNSLMNNLTLKQIIDLLNQYKFNLELLPKQIELKSNSSSNIRICFNCKQTPTSNQNHYICSHCHSVVLCEKCEENSEQIHPFDFIKIKPRKQSTKTADSIDKSKHYDAFEIFRKKLIEAIEELKHNLINIDDDCNSSKNNDDCIIEKYESGTKFSKIWHIGNNGDFDWPSDTRLICIDSNIEPLNVENGSIPISALKVGEKFDLKIDFMIPSNLNEEKIFYSIWRFCCSPNNGSDDTNEINDNHEYFGQTIRMRVKGVPSSIHRNDQNNNNKVIVTNESTGTNECSVLAAENENKSQNYYDSNDISIPYPDCFDLSIPFIKNNDNNKSNYEAGKSARNNNHQNDENKEIKTKHLNDDEPKQQSQENVAPKLFASFGRQKSEEKQNDSLKNNGENKENQPKKASKSSGSTFKSSKSSASISNMNKMNESKRKQPESSAKLFEQQFPQIQFPVTSVMIDVANRMMQKNLSLASKSLATVLNHRINNTIDRQQQQHQSSSTERDIRKFARAHRRHKHL